MSDIKVSIIVPVFNCENTIKKSIASLQNQSLQDIEIILVDDGSTDTSGAICNEISKSDNRIIVLSKSNGGAGSARNAGISIASGEFIGFMDSDDLFEKTAFETMYNTAKTNDVDIVRCNTIIVQKDSRKVCWVPDFAGEIINGNTIKSRVIPMMIAPEDEGHFEKRLLKGCVCCLFNRKLIVDNNIQFCDLKSGEDAIFTMTAMWNANRMIQIEKPFYIYNKQESDSLSISMDRLQNYEARNRSKKMVLDIVGDSEYRETYEKRFIQANRRYVYLDLRIATIYNPGMSKSEKIQLIRSIVNSEEAKSAFATPYQGKLPTQMRILYGLIKNKCSLPLYYAILFKFKKA